MYEVSANINNVEVRKVNLLPSFQLDLEKVAEAIDENTKLIFICSPNNPTGNSIVRTDIETVLANFNGLVSSTKLISTMQNRAPLFRNYRSIPTW
jgi:histidinol-phosphate aminotransferase